MCVVCLGTCRYNCVSIVWFQTRLELIQLTEPLDRAEASGRVAFSCPDAEVKMVGWGETVM